jgi:branched-chain amino acid transport system ATP-binding protein
VAAGRTAQKARRDKVEATLAATGLGAKRNARPVDLAYAERKFLSLARIMASGARLWLLDEPASGLDPGSYQSFLSLLRQQVREGVTICIIEHNLDIVQGISDRIAFLDQGRLLAEGDPKTILSDPALAAIFRRTGSMTAAVLKAENLRVGYGGKPVLLDVSIELRPREVLCLIGHNGAGKSTLLRTLFGLTKPEAGRVLVDGQRLPRHLPRALAAHGVAMVPEGRGVFPGLTVAEIFALGMWSAGVPEAERPQRVEWVLEVLSPIRAFYHRRAGLLSGGQQQMVSIGRALLAQPRCLLMDEPSIGLAPKLFQ